MISSVVQTSAPATENKHFNIVKQQIGLRLNNKLYCLEMFLRKSIKSREMSQLLYKKNSIGLQHFIMLFKVNLKLPSLFHILTLNEFQFKVITARTLFFSYVCVFLSYIALHSVKIENNRIYLSYLNHYISQYSHRNFASDQCTFGGRQTT